MKEDVRDNVMGADNQAGKAPNDESYYKKNKAYLFGAQVGDGCCFTKQHSFTIVSGDRDVIERVKVIVNQILQKNYPLAYIRPNNVKLYHFRTYNKKLFKMLMSETENKKCLPKFVVDSDKRIIAEFIAGLMDTDGYISAGTNKFGQQRFSLGFVNSGEWIDEFIALLQKLGIKVGKKTLKKKYRGVSEKDCYQININLRSFVENNLYFCCGRKQNILEKYKSRVRYQSYGESSETACLTSRKN